MEKALAEARQSAAKAGVKATPIPGTGGGRWLALIPVTAALLVFFLMMPRPTPPDDVPLPRVDGNAFDALVADDRARAAAAATTRLDGDLLSVGTAMRAVNKLVATGGMAEDVAAARFALQQAAGAAVGSDTTRGLDGLRSLRATQLEAFLAEVKRFEATGKVSDELNELGGGFVERMNAAGWVQEGRVVLDESERRVSYKLVWAATLAAEHKPGLALTLDEQRVLYRFYLTHPHAPETERLSFEDIRRKVKSDEECKKTVAKETAIALQWRIDKIKRLGEIDPTYPTSYALGVAYYRVGRFDQSLTQFRDWIAKHPDGPYTIRAHNHLKASFAAWGPS